MARQFNHERAAAVLVDAAYMGDGAAAKKWKVTVRTIELWRARLKTDPILSEFFVRKRKAAEGNWVGELRRALGSVLDKSRLIVESIEPVVVKEDPETGFQEQHVNMEALPILIAAGKGMGEIALALEVLNAGDAQQNERPSAPGANVADRPPLLN